MVALQGRDHPVVVLCSTKYSIMKLSIIIPVYNEAKNITALLRRLRDYRFQGHEVIVVDGGSSDNSFDCAMGLVDKLLMSKQGRALQMNIGAEQAQGDILLFLHADTHLPKDADKLIASVIDKDKSWGRFNVSLSGQHVFFRIIETMINFRSCITGIATGDQAIFVKRSIFEQSGAYPEIKLMEDVALSKRLKSHGKPACINERVTTSSRRWEEKGIVKTVLLMWRLRLMYFLGISPEKLSSLYYR